MTRDTATRCTCTYLYLLELQCNMQCRKTNKMKTTKGLKRLTVYHTCRLGYITPFRYNKRVWQTDRQTDRQTELVQQLRIPRFASAQWCKTALLPCMQISLKHETARNGNKVIVTTMLHFRQQLHLCHFTRLACARNMRKLHSVYSVMLFYYCQESERQSYPVYAYITTPDFERGR